MRLRKSFRRLDLRVDTIHQRRSAAPEWQAMLERIDTTDRERRLVEAEAALNRLNSPV